MNELDAVLSSLVKDRIRHYELVKVHINNNVRKLYTIVADKGIYLVMCNLSCIVKGGIIKHEHISSLYMNSEGTLITLELKNTQLPIQDNEGITRIKFETLYHTPLFEAIKTFVETSYMLLNYKEPKSAPIPNVEFEKTLSPFIGYKRNQHSIQEIVYDYKMTEDPMDDLCLYARGFLQTIKSEIIENGENKTYFAPYIILMDGIRFKKMNLNNDIAKWSCYHVFLRTKSKIIALFVHRRQCMFYRIFTMPRFTTNVGYIPRHLREMRCCNTTKFVQINSTFVDADETQLLNELYITGDSFTSINQKFFWHKDLIQIRLDNLRFEYDMYQHLKMSFGMLPSYFKLIKGFIGSLLKMLPSNAIDKAYTSSGIPGVGTITETKTRRVLINNFTMRLADYIVYCMDEMVLGVQLSVATFTRHYREMDSYNKGKLKAAIAYLMHFRPLDMTSDYSPALFDKIIETYKSPRTIFEWRHVIFNQYAVTRFLEEGFISVQFDKTQDQIDKSQWDGYVHLLTKIIELVDKYEIQKKISLKIMQLPIPIPLTYLPLANSLVAMLRNKHSLDRIVPTLLSLLINFAFQQAEFKLMTNLTKIPKHQEAFIQAGVLSNLQIVLENYGFNNAEIVAHAAGVLGQLCNSKFTIADTR
ncbi:hypothetical protein BdWA1_002455 [Babesia duncani]|uniref:Uncharacterized protein n=1 Tax=Babesia duncani TaxID=323732 RepID=A0AAD9PK06_9APIC|nr:hypothetical protein BdWA1_002455 [Babesia duncani]